MGLFGIFRAKETPSEPPKKEPSPFAPALIEIARIISGGDEEVLQDVTSCAQDPKGWFAAHQERYEERGVVDDPDDLDQVQWLGLRSGLEGRAGGFLLFSPESEGISGFGAGAGRELV